MIEYNTPIENIINDKRCVNRLHDQGFRTYKDIKDFTIEQYLSIPGIGKVSAHRAFQSVNEFREDFHLRVESIHGNGGVDTTILEELENLLGFLNELLENRNEIREEYEWLVENIKDDVLPKTLSAYMSMKRYKSIRYMKIKRLAEKKGKYLDDQLT